MLKFFRELNDADRRRLLDCLDGRRIKADAGQIIFREGESATHFGIVLSGAVNVVRYSLDGRERLLTHLGPGEAFGTTFTLAGAGRYFANIEAVEPTEALMLNGARVLSPCTRGCPLHVTLLTRLLQTIASRNSMLARKIDCLTQRTTAEKLLAYLRMQAEFANARTFSIPFTRQQLADYLNVDRSALSTEIGKLVTAGALRTTGRAFTLLR